MNRATYDNDSANTVVAVDHAASNNNAKPDEVVSSSATAQVKEEQQQLQPTYTGSISTGGNQQLHRMPPPPFYSPLAPSSNTSTTLLPPPPPPQQQPERGIVLPVVLPNHGTLGLTLEKQEDGASLIISKVAQGGQGERFGCFPGDIPVIFSSGIVTKIPYIDFLKQCQSDVRPIVFSVLRSCSADAELIMNNMQRGINNNNIGMQQHQQQQFSLDDESRLPRVSLDGEEDTLLDNALSAVKPDGVFSCGPAKAGSYEAMKSLKRKSSTLDNSSSTSKDPAVLANDNVMLPSGGGGTAAVATTAPQWGGNPNIPPSPDRKLVIQIVLSRPTELGLTLMNEEGTTGDGKGVIITEVAKGSQGEEAGCRAGDIPIYYAAGRVAKIPFESFLQQAQGPRPVSFSVLRNVGVNDYLSMKDRPGPPIPEQSVLLSMTNEQLHNELTLRNVSMNKNAHRDVFLGLLGVPVIRWREYRSWKASEMKAELKKRGLKVSGRKDELLERLGVPDGFGESAEETRIRESKNVERALKKQKKDQDKKEKKEQERLERVAEQRKIQSIIESDAAAEVLRDMESDAAAAEELRNSSSPLSDQKPRAEEEDGSTDENYTHNSPVKAPNPRYDPRVAMFALGGDPANEYSSSDDDDGNNEHDWNPPDLPDLNFGTM